MPKKRNNEEEMAQARVVKWCRANQIKYPDLRWITASLNGVRLTEGPRQKAKRSGMNRGFPDLQLPVRNNIYSGLFIEMKREKGGVISKEQKLWIKHLKSQGYCAKVCRGHDEAKDLIKKYLGII